MHRYICLFHHLSSHFSCFYHEIFYEIQPHGACAAQFMRNGTYIFIIVLLILSDHIHNAISQSTISHFLNQMNVRKSFFAFYIFP